MAIPNIFAYHYITQSHEAIELAAAKLPEPETDEPIGQPDPLVT
jgi:hypothetical protein